MQPLNFFRLEYATTARRVTAISQSPSKIPVTNQYNLWMVGNLPLKVYNVKDKRQNTERSPIAFSLQNQEICL